MQCISLVVHYNTPNMITIENLAFSYRKKQPLFDQLCLSLPAGNIYGLLGKNGAGKSTLLKLITGLLFPQAGTIGINGYRPADRNPGFLREIFLVTEEFFVPSITPEEFLALNSPFYPRFDHGRYQHYINEFRIPRRQKLAQLSYGQKKNFLLSFGLATDCNLLILDEPTNGLDIPSKSIFRKIVAQAIHDERSFVISTHQARDMENLIDPIIILDEGHIVFNHSYEEISDKLRVERCTELPPEKDILYYESNFGQHTVLRENHSNAPSNINLELLFNAVISNSEPISEIFKTPLHENV